MKARLAVTVALLALDRVAVTVATPAASAIGLPERLRVTKGSLSKIVYVWTVFAPRPAFTGVSRVTWIVSSGSFRLSFTTVIETFLERSPGLKVHVPE